MKTYRMLIADDHELVRQGMHAIFESEPQWVVCGKATTRQQALTMTLEMKPDLVVLDVALPEMNGIEVTRQNRRTVGNIWAVSRLADRPFSDPRQPLSPHDSQRLGRPGGSSRLTFAMQQNTNLLCMDSANGATIGFYGVRV